MVPVYQVIHCHGVEFKTEPLGSRIDNVCFSVKEWVQTGTKMSENTPL